MHHANHFYGHAHILARYCGLSEASPPRVNGYLQHGWSIGDGLARGTPYVTGSPIFVWSEQTRRRAWSVGRRNVVVIGAPWIYLLAMEREEEPAAERHGTIFYPFHGWEAQNVKGDHRRLISYLREVETEPITVCLYWHEYQSTRLRRVYERAGFRVICHGYRGRWWAGTDTKFLYRQLAELRRHRRVVSNRISSALWYGILAGCEPAVYGDPMVLEDEDMTFGGVARTRRQWPELHGATVDLAVARAAAHAELGTEFLASPAELRELFGWSSPPSSEANRAPGAMTADAVRRLVQAQSEAGRRAGRSQFDAVKRPGGPAAGDGARRPGAVLPPGGRRPNVGVDLVRRPSPTGTGRRPSPVPTDGGR